MAIKLYLFNIYSIIAKKDDKKLINYFITGAAGFVESYFLNKLIAKKSYVL
jgi:hypothetical protein